MARPMDDLTGKRFGSLTVIEATNERKSECVCWICKCDCGKITHPIRSSHLKNGNTTSCGCYNSQRTIESHTTHGKSHSRLYRVYYGMKQRCGNPKFPKYKWYGAIGIKVCAEWQKDFQAFYDWAMANGYDPNAERGKCTLDRINVDGDYSPENCRWITIQEQQKNKRKGK